ncbi:MAG: F0F1 ATP synthase subunit delta [Streptosporangiales bacterium]|nr:F0F1 ATP synthase subunit delta [Streptosporangiales bacterium]
MQGVSRTSMAEVRERFDSVSAGDPALLAGELFDVVDLFDREHLLRRALADPARPGEAKSAAVHAVLDGKVSTPTAEVAAAVVQARWARSGDLTDALESLAVYAEALAAEQAGELDELEDELFRFSRIVESEPRLRTALTDVGAPVERRVELVERLLDGKTSAFTRRLIGAVVARPRGRSLEAGLATYGRLVAERRQRLVALARVAGPLTEEQRERLVRVLTTAYGHEVHLNVEIDPTVVGGLSIQVGDEVIDGTIAGRLEEVRRRLQ